ncbi:MAG: cysteine--tRNA ligase [Proteobacteria bacterium]|nr:cysteine--tRNA ligase [Pseudomonadota bacterium]
MTDLRLFNSLTRQLETFQPIRPGKARVYTCGPTVYNYQHIGNMRAYVFADTLGRTLRFKGYELTHVINITDVGHLTSDADAGEDKMERMAAREGRSAWDIAKFYQEDFERDLARLNVEPKKHPRATEYVEAMIEWGKRIAVKHCYELDSGLYFDVTTVADYGRLARAHTDDGEGRIETVEGKRNAADFAIWRKTPPGETRQMEWDSPWGRGAPGWHLECSVMGEALLGFPFDIHTGGIDHREIHHPNEIAQNQAYCCTNGLDLAENSGARIWMHNNFLVERAGKMSKSSGEFLRLQLLVDKGYHPLAYRMLCLQAHYRSELEFSWEGLGASLTFLKRWVGQLERLSRHNTPNDLSARDRSKLERFEREVEEAISDDLNTPKLLALANGFMFDVELRPVAVFKGFDHVDQILGLGLLQHLTRNPMKLAASGALLALNRTDLRIPPMAATITEPKIKSILAQRKEARSARDFATSDRLRDELAAQGVEVMDGDPLGWDWKLGE